MQPRIDDNPSPDDRRTAFVDGMLGPAFLLLAAWFLLSPLGASIPFARPAAVTSDLIRPGARREAIVDPPGTLVGGYQHTCNDCHRLFNSPPLRERNLMQHDMIILNHGMNSRCFNCHDDQDRERLVLMDGTTLPFEQTPRLCAQCHGTVYRDWQRGTHGKTLGSWDAASGLQHRLKCNECHDPHAPAYEPFKPLPGPNTLRMGEQGAEHEHAGTQSPLRRHAAPAAEHTPSPKETPK